MRMPPKEKNYSTSPEINQITGPEQAAELTDLHLTYTQGFEVLKAITATFQDERLKPEAGPIVENAPRYDILNRTLSDGSSVNMQWGSNADRNHTLADVEIKQSKGRTLLTLDLNQDTNVFKVEFDTTVADEGPCGDPIKDAQLAVDVITKAKGQLLKKDITRPNPRTVALAGLKKNKSGGTKQS